MSQHRFSRRTMLRGIGVSMALPWLESLNVWGDMTKGSSVASEAPVRMAVLFAGNGFHGNEWWAKGDGKAMELGKVLTPLASYRERMLFIRGLFNAEALNGNIHQFANRQLVVGRATCVRRRNPFRHEFRSADRSAVWPVNQGF